MLLDKDKIESLYFDAMNDSLYQAESINRKMFKNYLIGLKEKLLTLKTKEAKRQLLIIEGMERSLERQLQLIASHNLQAKMLGTLSGQIMNLEHRILEQQKEIDKLNKIDKF